MKLTTRDIDGFLRTRSPQPVVLIYGPDHGLIRARAIAAIKHVVADVNDPFNVAVVSAETIVADPARLNDEAMAQSLMGGDRVVWVREAGDGLALALKHYLVNPARHCLVVIEGGDLPAKSTLRKLIEGDKNAVALPCYVQEARDLKGMMIERLRAAGLTIDPDALALWADAVAGDYQQVNGEIEKLLTYMGVDGSGRVRVPARVSEADVRAVTAGMGTASMDGFIDAWLLGRSEAAMTHLARLLDDGVALVAVARAILYHTRKIESTHHAIAAGASLDAILEGRDAPVFFKRKAAFAQQVRRWPIPKLSRLMHEVFLAEAKLKSGVDPDASVPQALLALSRRVG